MELKDQSCVLLMNMINVSISMLLYVLGLWFYLILFGSIAVMTEVKALIS